VTERTLPPRGGLLAALAVTLLFAVSGFAELGAQSGPGAGRRPPTGTWEWWNDADVQREVGLSAERVASINGFYQKRVKELKTVVERYIKEQTVLDQLTKSATVDEATYNAQVIQVESLRSELNRSRTVMLYRIYQQLQPEQYRKLQGIFERNRERMERERSGRGRGQNAQ
jgi:Spy/CpxP family protein refolding chaperone